MNRRTFIKNLSLAGATTLIGRRALCLENSWTERMRPMMGSFVNIAVYDTKNSNSQDTINRCFAYLEKEVSSISSWVPSSCTSKLNAQKVLSLSECSPSLLELMKVSRQLHSLSNGKFSPYTGALTSLWRQARKEHFTPSSLEIAHELKKVADAKLVTDNHNLLLDAETTLEFGGIGKGFIADRAWEFLRNNGVEIARIDCGGDLRFLGNIPWEVEIKHPRKKGILMKLNTFGNVGVATSGDYNECWVENDRRIHHLIDLESGYPSNYAQSVTIITHSTTLADGLATAIFSMPTQTGLQIASKLPGTDILIVDRKGELHKTHQLSLDN